jgi:hypothetical protein
MLKTDWRNNLGLTKNCGHMDEFFLDEGRTKYYVHICFLRFREWKIPCT